MKMGYEGVYITRTCLPDVELNFNDLILPTLPLMYLDC